MPYSTVAESRPRLLNPWSLGLVGLLCLVILILVFPRQAVFKLGKDDKVDGVSIAYAELLLRSNPQDDALRIDLVEQLIRVGNLDRAEALLVKSVAPEFAAQARFLALEVKLQRFFAEPEGVIAQQHDGFANEIATLLDMQLSNPQMQRLAEMALAFSAPRLAADAYARLSVMDAENASYWLELGARWYTAAGQHMRAAALYRKLEQLATSDTERERFQLQMFKTLIAGGEGARALRWLDTQLVDLPASPFSLELLQAGIREARGHSDNARALSYLDRWHALQPNDPEWLRQAFAVTFGSGQLEQAWTLGQQLYAAEPSEPLLRQLANLAEWAGHPVQALPLWMQLARENASLADYDHAWRLSGQLFDYPQMSILITELADIRALNLEELKALVFALEMQARPEDARDWLALYVQRRPAERDAWRMLAQINRNMQHLHDETLVWESMSKRHELTEQELIFWAETHWKLFEPQSAWDVLASLPLNKARSLNFLQLRNELAQALELDDQQLATLELLAQKRGRLLNDQSEALFQLYLQRDPRKALALVIAKWQRTKSLSRLVQALQLSEQLGDWEQLDRLLKEAQPFADQLQGEPVYWQVRVRSAFKRNDEAQLDRFLTQLLDVFPDQSWAIELYLWSQIDRQQSEGLAARLQDWRSLARQEGSLWLPFASAYGLLGNVKEALYWYRLFIRANPADQLALAAYADTLDQAGHADSAFRLRRYLLAQWRRTPPAEESSNLQPERYVAYLRLLASVAGVQRARLVSQQALSEKGAVYKPMLEAWFERWIAQMETLKNTGAIDAWLAWARQHGLKVDGHTRLQSALRSVRRKELQGWLAREGLPPESRAEIWLRLGLDQRAQIESQQAINANRSAAQNSTLRVQAQGVLERQPRGIQVVGANRDYGGLSRQDVEWLMATGIGDQYLSVKATDSRYYGSNKVKVLVPGDEGSDEELRHQLDTQRLGHEQVLAFALESPMDDGAWLTEAELVQNDFAQHQGLGLTRSWRVSNSDALALGFAWHQQTDESGLLHALGMRNSAQVEGQHALSGRDQLSWRLARNYFETWDGSGLGNGWAGSLDLSHNVLAREPQWTVRTGVSWQKNQPVDQLPDYLLRSNGGVLVDNAAPTDLLTERYSEVYVGSSWQRGTPGALNRAWPQFTYKLDSTVGWQVHEKSFAYALEAGLGVEVFGSDELALMAGYNSAPVGGEGQAGSQLRLAYSLRFGR